MGGLFLSPLIVKVYCPWFERNQQALIMTVNYDSKWHIKNASDIRTRLSPHLDTKELAQIIPSGLQGIFVRTIDDVMELYCYEPETRDLSDIMSRVNLNAPLDLIAVYSQVMFLTQVWQQLSPKRVYIAGFGGGRLGMAYHHYNGDVFVDGSDFDPAILEVARSHFGIEYDDRYSIAAADSAQDLETRETLYDIIIIDVFSNSGQHASHLASREFFTKCRRKLNADGVLAINLIERDPERSAKISNMASVFPQLMEWRQQGSHIVFASKTEACKHALLKRAETFERDANLTFPYSEHAKALQLVDLAEYRFG